MNAFAPDSIRLQAGDTLAPPPGQMQRAQTREAGRWQQVDSDINAVTFGFIASAILISMFLVMAIFERILRPRNTASVAELALHGSNGGHTGPPTTAHLPGKLEELHTASAFDRGFSVIMPGQDTPTFIAHPVPNPCPPERMAQYPHTISCSESSVDHGSRVLSTEEISQITRTCGAPSS